MYSKLGASGAQPVILATQEAEIRRIVVRSQLGFFKRPYLEKNPSHKHKKKRPGGVSQGVGPEFKLQYCKKKKKNC
jgi:hypothetical protein